MAIVIRGKTKCALCGTLLRDGDEVISFPAFVANQLDPLWRFSDAAFHSTCFQEDPLAKRVDRRYEEFRNHVGPGHRMCVVCKREITDPDDYFSVGHLTEDPEHPLYCYNYVQAHRSCLPRWSERSQVAKLIAALKNSGAWGGPALDFLLNELNSHKSNADASQ